MNRAKVFIICLASLIVASCSPFKKNFHQVDENYYRSGQMGAGMLREKVQKHGIRTLINLRGEASEEYWWNAEREAAEDLGIAYHNITLWSYKEPPKEGVLKLIRTLKSAEYPVLAHCRHGANRAGLSAVIYLLEVKGKSYEEARRQLRLRYGHFPSKLDKFLRRYKTEAYPEKSLEEWLLTQ